MNDQTDQQEFVQALQQALILSRLRRVRRLSRQGFVALAVLVLCYGAAAALVVWVAVLVGSAR